MSDQSHLDRKYFIDKEVYNCPFCNRRNVKYEMWDYLTFDWTNDKECRVHLVRCSSCEKVSMHLSYEEISGFKHHASVGREVREFKDGIDIDSKIFYSVPTSFFVIDNRVPKILRELMTEAEQCLKMNLLTGASACLRKAIYELLVIEKADGANYETRIKSLKAKYTQSDADLFDILAQIQDMTSDKIHEQSWDKWDSNKLKLIIETLKAVLYDIYVLPKQKEDRSIAVKKLRERIMEDKQKKRDQPN